MYEHRYELRNYKHMLTLCNERYCEASFRMLTTTLMMKLCHLVLGLLAWNLNGKLDCKCAVANCRLISHVIVHVSVATQFSGVTMSVTAGPTQANLQLFMSMTAQLMIIRSN